MSRRTVHAVTRTPRAAAWTFLTALLVLGTTGCEPIVPSDPDGTLDRIESTEELHVGVSPDTGLVFWDGEEASGPLAETVEGFADELGVRISWVEGSEETLVGLLEAGRIDIAVGGFTDETPWLDRAGVTRGYPGIEGSDDRAIVMLVPLGENRLLSELETYLDAELAP